MPVCPCCNKVLSKRQILHHEKFGPSLSAKIGAFARGERDVPYRVERHVTKRTRTSVEASVPGEPGPSNANENMAMYAVAELPEENTTNQELGELDGFEQSLSKHRPQWGVISEDDSEDSLTGSSQAGPYQGSELFQDELYAEDESDLGSNAHFEPGGMLAEEKYVIPEETGTLRQDQFNSIQMFSLFLNGKITRSTFSTLLRIFGEQLGLSTQYHVNKVVEYLARIKVEKYDCCAKSCIAFLGPHADDEMCPTCKHPRYKPSVPGRAKKPYYQFTYIPLIPRLQGYFTSPDMVELLGYRATRVPEPGTNADIFDGSYLQKLMKTHVKINDEPQTFKYFEFEEDICLGLMGDGVKLFKRSTKSMWPFVLLNYSLPPEIRTHLIYLIPLMIVPGPHQPKDHNSFLIPFRDEMLALARGVWTYHCVKKEQFLLHAYLVTNIADMQGFKANQYIKGPNAFSPCRTCKLQGCRHPMHTNYYYPLRPPSGALSLDPGTRPQRWDPRRLPERTHLSYKQSVAYILAGTTKKEQQRRAKTEGINGESILVDLPGFDRAQSGPHDFMHLVYENIIPTLVELWTGVMTFPEAEDEPYWIAPRIWETIGKETEAATRTIPAFFCGTIPDIASHQGLFTAESWAFWFQNLMPYLLKDRLASPYYTHGLALCKIIKLCLQFSINEIQIQELETLVIKWVKEYEKLYYQYKLDRISACTSCLHALLHVPLEIRRTGPIWMHWMFAMERYCGHLLSQIKSRRFPYQQVMNRMLARAQLNQVVLKHNLVTGIIQNEEESQISGREHIYPEYPATVLRTPCNRNYRVEPAIRRKIAAHLVTQFGANVAHMLEFVPVVMESWAKVRVQGGDSLRTRSTLTNIEGRDQSFVRYDLHVDKLAHRANQPPQFEITCFYGELETILSFQLNPSPIFRNTPLRKLFAVVRECITHGLDATIQPVTYTGMSPALTVIELTAISCCVGRVKIGTGKKWGIIDRSNSWVRPIFLEEEAE